MNADMTAVLSQTNFTALDWGIVIVYLAASVLIGLAVKKYVGNMADYVSAGRTVGTALGVATMTGTEMGLITIMYSAQKGFVGGFAAFHIALVAGVVTLLVGLTGFLVVRLRELRVLTIPEFYERRFGRKTRILGGIMLTFGGVLNMGLFLKVGSMFIVGITGMSAHGYALKLVMATLLVLVLFYTVLGGMISVIITDYVQFVVLSIGLLAATVLAVDKVGWDHVFQTITAQMGAKGYNPFLSEGAFGWDYVVWMGFLGLVSCALWPTAVARALAMESTASVKRLYKWSAVSFTIRFLIPYFLGICAFVFIMTLSPDLKSLFFPAADSGVKAMDNLYALPIFLGRILPIGMIGLITAAMIAAFMSTHDSYLLCWSSVITQDIVAPLFGDRLSTKGRILLTRVLIVIIGLYILWWGLFYEGKQDIWDYMAVTGAIYFTGAFALLLGGLYWKRASSTGAVLALVSGCSAILGLEPVQKLLNFPALEKALGFQFTGARVGLFTIVFTLTVMIAGSLLFPDPLKTEPASPVDSGGDTSDVAGADMAQGVG
ncbi:MAG: sodium:solute symporter family protein [Kiritimatiellaeota bacterium]|nr:sodium:solute symporter family protein [Kiritimatiellota bacterium]